MPHRILFLDITCPAPYDADTLETSPLGGTEASVIRVAEALADRGHEVIVAQHNRLSEGTGKAIYASFEALDSIFRRPRAVIGLRTTKLIPYMRERWGADSRLLLWAHDFNQQEFVKDYGLLQGSGIKILGVSRTHAAVIKDALHSQIGEVRGVTAGYIYNPVVASALRDDEGIDNNKLVFLSSPHKGLKQTLKVFERMRANIPGVQLHLCNPGYYPDIEQVPEGVVNHGPLPHAKAMELARNALCLFSLNAEFPETFGLVYAECAAMGVPSLTAPVGALHEILGLDPRYYVDVRNEKAVIDRIEHWRNNNRPVPPVRPEFQIERVTNRWEEVIQ